MDVLVTGVEDFGLFAQGIELPAEGLIHVDALGDDFYRYERASHTLTGRKSENRFRLGDKLRAVVAHVDVDRRQLDFRIVGREGSVRSDKKAMHGTQRGKRTTGRGRGTQSRGIRGRKENRGRQPRQGRKGNRRR
jgi:ribonuclease R